MSDERPTAWVIRRKMPSERDKRLGDDFELWTVKCPLCGSEHCHGEGEGHRVAHCSNPPDTSGGGYYVKLP